MTQVITHSLAIWAYFFHDYTVESFDEAEATRGMTARSLQMVFYFSLVNSQPLFKVNISRMESIVLFSPSVKEIVDVLAELVYEILDGIKVPNVETRVMLNLRFPELIIPTITKEDDIIQQTFTLLKTILNILFYCNCIGYFLHSTHSRTKIFYLVLLEDTKSSWMIFYRLKKPKMCRVQAFLTNRIQWKSTSE